jgi:prophage antirepressor-like protein
MSHVILKSRHPRATAINDWMYDTVLPSLILHGRYVVDEGELAEIRAVVEELHLKVEKLTEDRDLLKRENRVLWEHTDMRLSDLAGLNDTN